MARAIVLKRSSYGNEIVINIYYQLKNTIAYTVRGSMHVSEHQHSHDHRQYECYLRW